MCEGASFCVFVLFSVTPFSRSSADLLNSLSRPPPSLCRCLPISVCATDAPPLCNPAKDPCCALDSDACGASPQCSLSGWQCLPRFDDCALHDQSSSGCALQPQCGYKTGTGEVVWAGVVVVGFIRGGGGGGGGGKVGGEMRGLWDGDGGMVECVMCLHVCMRACVRACVYACMHACVRPSVRQRRESGVLG